MTDSRSSVSTTIIFVAVFSHLLSAGVFSNIEICSGLVTPTDVAAIQSTSIAPMTGSMLSTSALPEPSPAPTAPLCGLTQLATGS